MKTILLGGLLLATMPAPTSPEAPLVQTPGSLALILLQPFDATTNERLSTALQDRQPEVRAAAARVINAGGVLALAENVRRALASETDRYAAEEEILAAGALDGPAAVEPILAAAQRLRGSAVGPAAEFLARTYGVESLRHLPVLRSAGLSTFDDMFRIATKGQTEGLDSAAATLLAQNDTAAWSGLLNCVRRSGVSMDPSVIAQGLGSNSETIRAATYWHLAMSKTANGATAAGMDRSIEAALAAEPPVDLGGAVARELLARLMGRKAVEQTAWVAALSAKGFPAWQLDELARAPALLALLTPAEMKAASLAKYGDPAALSARLKKAHSEPRPVKGPRLVNDVVRTVDRFPPSFVASLLEAAGCDVRSGHGIAIAEITYGRDGRPHRIGIFGPPAGEQDQGGPPSCQRAARVLFASSLAPAGHPTDPQAKEILVALLDPPPLSCLAEDPTFASSQHVSADAGSDDHQEAGGRIREPKKTTNVHPRYPDAAHKNRIQGVVVLEATISPTGCIRSLELVSGVRALNWEALHAVSQWRYTPTLLNGVPVPVLMTVTVTFKLGG